MEKINFVDIKSVKNDVLPAQGGVSPSVRKRSGLFRDGSKSKKDILKFIDTISDCFGIPKSDLKKAFGV